MSVINNPLLLGQEGGGGYAISRSLRFNSSDSAYLSRTPASAGNRKTWTWAGWVKRSGLGRYAFFSAGSTTAASFGIEFDSSNCLWVYNYTSAFDWQLVTTPVYRDASAWYHIVISVDTTQGTAANRVRVYVNGVQVTAFSTATYPSSNSDTYVNTAAIHTLGCYQNQSLFSNLYLADVFLIDGQALDPTSFGEFSATTGVWMPKAYSGGSYGTNGFHLDFSNNASAAALGTDTSGNGNTWTVNNLSVTAGAGNDSLVDVPTNGSEVDTGSGGQVRGNYATLNPLQNATSDTFSNGNLQVTTAAGGNYGTHTSTIATPLSGKWYAEITIDAADGAYTTVGLVAAASAFSSTSWPGSLNGVSYAAFNGNYYLDTVNSSYGSTFGSIGDVVGIAYNADSGTAQFFLNGVSQGVISGVPVRPYYFGASDFWGVRSCTYTWNFGQRSWAYQAPSGFKALNTASLPAPVVTKPSTVMDVKLWTGNGVADRAITTGFSPDLVWLKCRSSAISHLLADSVRGGQNILYSNLTDAENGQGYNTNQIKSFTSTGFTVGDDSWVNWSTGASYAAWCWDAGGSTVTNTQGSITSSVRTNNYLSIVTYTGTGANATVGHGLGVAPQMIIVKSRGSVTNWGVGHTSIGWANALRLNTTDASSAQATFWNSTAPTSTVFSVGTGPSTNNNGDSIVAYCFAPVAGYSAFGSYTGNGSTDGPFVYTGFRPRWVLIKTSTLAGWGWVMYDTARNTSNIVNAELYAHSNNQEVTADRLDILSNGFKLRATSSYLNGSSETYVWAAFAESPFQYARAR